MKKIVLMMMVLMSMTAATAQNTEKKAPKAKQVMTEDNKGRMKAPKPMTIEERTDRTARMLQLNDEQKEKMLQLNKDYDTQLQSILTQEQYKKYQRMQQFNSRSHGRGAGPGRGHGGRPMGPRPDKAPAEDAPQE